MATSPTPMKKNKQVNRAPQKRTFHFFIRVVDEAGNVIPGAKLKVERIITDARKVIEFMDTPNYAELGLTRVKHEIISTKRGTEEDGATQVG
jgi:hypothetical protein